MSDKPIWSLATKRSELGKASKGVIYLVKIAQGAIVATVFAALGHLAHYSNSYLPIVAASQSLVVFVTAKVCWYAYMKEWPDRTSGLDWICDGSLMFVWLIPFAPRIAFVLVPAWLVSYPWSSE